MGVEGDIPPGYSSTYGRRNERNHKALPMYENY